MLRGLEAALCSCRAERDALATELGQPVAHGYVAFAGAPEAAAGESDEAEEAVREAQRGEERELVRAMELEGEQQVRAQPSTPGAAAPLAAEAAVRALHAAEEGEMRGWTKSDLAD